MLNGIVIIDKPDGWTSQDVVSRLRRVLSEKRIGHGGTLDPMATGVLPVFVGRATRASSMLLDSDKAYTAGLRLGLTTDTQDITGSILTQSQDIPDENTFISILSEFVGEQEQLPPMYSAIKVNGRKLYELARKGVEVERKPRRIVIYSVDYLGRNELGDYMLHVSCSKGSYIRTLIHDIGQRLGCGAALTSLRRTATGGFSEREALTLEQVAELTERGDLSFLRGVDTLFAEYPEVTTDEQGEKLCRSGVDVPFDLLKEGARYRVYGPGGFLMLADWTEGKLRHVKNFFNTDG